MTCPTCRAVELTEIGLVLRGNRVTMHSCSRCESRWWFREGERVDFRHVLHLAAPM
jgi:hypothetical protein